MDEKLRIRYFILPAVWVTIMFLQIMLQEWFHIDFRFAAMHPRHSDGLLGIFLMVFLHGDWTHFFSNVLPFVIFSIGLYHYYPFAGRLMIYMTVMTGIYVWLIGRDNYHVGASGLIYAMASFHITSALLRKELRLMAFAALIIFLYGSMIWGFFPEFFPLENISWEGHLMGFIVGIIYAFYYKDQGPKKVELVDDEEDEDEFPYWMQKTEENLKEEIN